MTVTQEIKSAIKEKKLVMGSRVVFKGVKIGRIDTVFYASNCPENVRKDLDHYAKLSKIKIEKFEGNANQLGEICGKPFNILMVGVMK